MLRIAIVEDEEEFIRQIQVFIKQYQKENAIEIKVTIFRDGAEILDNYQAVYDVILFDIEMPEINGMEAAKQIRQSDADVVMMFITNMAQYAIQGYSVGALDFVMKPINYYTFSMKLARAIKRVKKKDTPQILLNLPDRLKKLDIERIYYVEVQNRMLHYHTDEGELVLRGTMKSVENQLMPYYFVKCNYWYIVNLMHVTEVRGNIAVVGGCELEISRRNKAAFLSALTEYVGGNL